MTLDDVIEESTWKPAQVIHQTELGHLSQGAPADITVLRIVQGNYGFLDTGGFSMPGKTKLECELTVRNGRVAWDLNGIAGIPFTSAAAGKPLP